MQIHRKSPRQTRKGYALLITMVFVGVSLLVLGSMMAWVYKSSAVAPRNNQFLASEYAAEAATERILAQMDHDFLAQSLTNAGFYEGLIPTNTSGWPVQYQFSNPISNVLNQTYVNIGATSSNTIALASPYNGLTAFVQQCQITSTATPLNQGTNIVPATVSEIFQAASIPIFQFAIFYNIDLEIDPGAAMTIIGNVHSNQGIWAGAGDCTFDSLVEAVGTVNTTTIDPFVSDNAKTDSSAPPTFVLSGQPVSGVGALTLPVAGTNTNPSAIESILQLPPAAYAMGTSAAYSTNGQVYLANAADLIISNAFNGTNFGFGALQLTGTNFTVYYQDSSLTGSPFLKVTNDFYLFTTNKTSSVVLSTNNVNPNKFPNANILYAGYTFLTNVLFYDWREGWNGGSGPPKAVQAVQFDVSKFNAWLASTNLNGTTNVNGGNYYNSLCSSSSHKDHPIDGIYIYNSVPLTGTTLPAVRVVNGQQLYGSHGLGIATPFPIYVEGNFNVQTPAGNDIAVNNTTYTYPAAFYADAITILSTSISDSGSKITKNSTPITTTINAACLEGIVQSTNSDYSGGVENFLRLLENWSNINLWYNGSIVVMFPSQYATNYWQGPGSGSSYYYGAPARDWAFDTNFTVQADLPPMTPQTKAIVRGQWNAY